MRWPVLVVLACGCDDRPHEMFPINPGGGAGGSGMMMVDAAINDDASAEITGRVCLVLDARAPTTCAEIGAFGLTVSLGTATTTTAEDGGFRILRPTGTNLVWRVSGTGIVASAMQLSAGSTIPAIDAVLYDEMLAVTQPSLQLGDGALIARFTRANAVIIGATVTATPAPDSGVFYDGVSVTDWDIDATGAFGVAWIPSIAPTASVQLTVTGATQHTFTGIPVFADTITFAFVEIP